MTDLHAFLADPAVWSVGVVPAALLALVATSVVLAKAGLERDEAGRPSALIDGLIAVSAIAQILLVAAMAARMALLAVGV